MKIITIKSLLISLLLVLFLSVQFPCPDAVWGLTKVDEPVYPNLYHAPSHEPVVQQLIDLVNSDADLKSDLEAALAEQEDTSYWHGKTLEDMYDFFDDWLVFQPTPDTARQYMDWFYEFADDGKGQIIASTDPFRSWLYDFMMARGQFMDSIESAAILPVWFADPDIHIEDYIIPPGGFQSFNEFFTRRIKDGLRPVDLLEDDSVLTSPADSTVLNIADELTAADVFDVKGESLCIGQLLGGNPLASKFIDGKAILCMLATTNYHRFHSPVNGRIVAQEQLGGLYYGMDGGWIEYFFQHRRGYFIFDTGDYGYVAMVCVGMFTISSINFFTAQGDYVNKGDELGNFAYGGSAIILLFEPGRVDITIPIESRPVSVQMGQKIGDLFALETESPGNVPQYITMSPSSSYVPEKQLLTPPRMVVKYLDVQPKTAQINQDIVIKANVVNSGDSPGEYTANLIINGSPEQTLTGTVGGHAVAPVEFIVSRSRPGNYIVDVNGQQSSFKVESSASNFQDISKYIPVLGFILCFTGIIVVIMLMLLRKRGII
jgi:phosphatidylserine decarboxylase